VAQLVLLVRDGPLAGQRVDVAEELEIGREAEGLKLEDEEASRHHAKVRTVEGRLEAEDLDSLNGTWVNGTRIEAVTPLAPGDVLKIGQTSFEIVDSGATVLSQRPATTPSAPAPPPPAPARAAAPRPAPAQPAAVAVTPFAPPTGRARRGVASRQIGFAVFAFGVVIADSVALLLYFGLR
jgi:pSer/pThr/pTyr-binding forkhead associated (FHA) protein